MALSRIRKRPRNPSSRSRKRSRLLMRNNLRIGPPIQTANNPAVSQMMTLYEMASASHSRLAEDLNPHSIHLCRSSFWLGSSLNASIKTGCRKSLYFVPVSATSVRCIETESAVAKIEARQLALHRTKLIIQRLATLLDRDAPPLILVVSRRD